MTRRRVAVVGAGLGGLAAALRLAVDGFEVDVFDQRSEPGGKASVVRGGGYRFDAGPSLLTMIDAFRELFAYAGSDLESAFEIVPLEEICRYFYPDGTVLHAYRDRNRFDDEIAALTGEPRGCVSEFLSYSGRIYDAAAELFLQQSLHDYATYLSRAFVRSLVRVPRIDPFRTMARANEKYFTSPKLRQLFNRYATYNGSNPYRTPATLNLIPHVEFSLGGLAVRQGIHAIPVAIETLAKNLGVQFHYNSPVSRIVTNGGAVTGIRLDGDEMRFDAVVSNVDVSTTYAQLLAEPGAAELQKNRRLEPSSSGIIYYWGVRGAYPQFSLNNVLFSKDYAEEFRQLFDEHRVPDDPTIYLNITSKVSSADAPDNCENWFVLVNAPPDRGQRWEPEAARLRDVVVERFSHVVGLDIGPHIDFEQRVTPAEIARTTRSYLGSLYGVSSNSRFSAFLRHPDRSRRHRGLYFCGGSVHPGGGMPLAILSGRIAATLLSRDYRRRAGN